MDNLKSTFNRKVIDLRQRKMQLVHECKQFEFYFNMIRNELVDSEIMIPFNFPEDPIDESIDVRSII